MPSERKAPDREIVFQFVERIEVSQDNIRIALKSLSDVGGMHQNSSELEPDATDQIYATRYVDIPWRAKSSRPLAHVDEGATRGGEPDPALIQAVARAHLWTQLLTDGKHTTIDSLAVSTNMHPKVIRKSIRLAFLAPEITEAIVLGCQRKSLSLTDLQKATSLSWLEQRRKLGFGERGNLSNSILNRTQSTGR
jgi:hypothetical protein